MRDGPLTLPVAVHSIVVVGFASDALNRTILSRPDWQAVREEKEPRCERGGQDCEESLCTVRHSEVRHAYNSCLRTLLRNTHQLWC